jgi:ubiquinone biosynthesis accessory factor UbiK
MHEISAYVWVACASFDIAIDVRGTDSVATLRTMTIDELVTQLREAMSANTGAGADLQKNLRATLSVGLSKLDVVTRQEFEIQREMLDVLRKQVDELSAQVAEYETKQNASK